MTLIATDPTRTESARADGMGDALDELFSGRGCGRILNYGSDEFSESGFTVWGLPLVVADGRSAGGAFQRGLSRAVSRGHAVRLRPSVYAEQPAWDEALPRQRFLATVAAVAISRRLTPVFCRQAALVLHDLPLIAMPTTVDSRAGGRGSARTLEPALNGEARYPAFGEARHLWPLAWNKMGTSTGQSGETILPTGTGRTVEEILPNGTVLAVEKLAFAIADTLPRLPLGDAVVVLDALLSGRRHRSESARIEEPWTRDDLVAVASLCPSAVARRRFLDTVSLASDRSESVAESWSMVRFHELGFEKPQQQHVVVGSDGEKIARGDFWWEGVRAIGECDGLKKYAGAGSYSGEPTEEVIRLEREREDRIRAEGIAMVRWDWSDLKRPRRLVWKLDQAGVPRR